MIVIVSLMKILTGRRYFYQDTAATPSQPQLVQTSVVRSNCMDWYVFLPCVIPELA